MSIYRHACCTVSGPAGWWVGSVFRALDWRSKGQGFESHQEHKNNFFSESKRLYWLAVSVPNPLCVYACIWKTMYAHYRSCSPCQSSVDYGNMKITSMNLYPQRRNVAAQVAEKFKTVTYATSPMEERRRRRRRSGLTALKTKHHRF